MAVSKQQRIALKDRGLWNYSTNRPNSEFHGLIQNYRDIDDLISDPKIPLVPKEKMFVVTDENFDLKATRQRLKDQRKWDHRNKCPKDPNEYWPVIVNKELQHKHTIVRADVPPPPPPPKEKIKSKYIPPVKENTNPVKNDKLAFRDVGIEKIDKLLWIKEDRGGFGIKDRDGPIYDWQCNVQDILKYAFERGTVLQAGGNCGMYARFYANYFNKVITVEPEGLNFECLSYNCSDTNKFDVRRGALSNYMGTCTVTGSYRNCGIFRIKQESGDIPVFTIDSLDLQECDLIHLDLEGHEDRALKGALETIKKFEPTVITERGRARGWLTDLGYKEVKLKKQDTLFYKPHKKKEVRRRDKVIICGSGFSAEKLKDMNTRDVNIVTINNSWMLSDKWNINVHAPDHPRDRRPEPTKDKRIISASGEGYIKAVNKHGGLRNCGYSITLAGSYWALENLDPKQIGFIGCDMNYKPNNEGHTAFYGVGLDIKKRKKPDPDQMAERYGKDNPEEYLRSVYQRFYDIAKSKGVEVFNISGEENTRLPYPMKTDFL